MLEIAIRKATEAGFFSRHCLLAEHQTNRRIMEAILLAALETGTGDSGERGADGKSPPRE